MEYFYGSDTISPVLSGFKVIHVEMMKDTLNENSHENGAEETCILGMKHLWVEADHIPFFSHISRELIYLLHPTKSHITRNVHTIITSYRLGQMPNTESVFFT